MRTGATLAVGEHVRMPRVYRGRDAQWWMLGCGVRTIVWATGFRPDYSWLNLPVFDRRGDLRHEGGVVDAPGLHVLGLPYLRRRKSSFIRGAEDDVRELCVHLGQYLDRAARRQGARIAV